MHIWSAISTVIAYFVAQFAVAWALATNAVNSSLNGVNTLRKWIEMHAAAQTLSAMVGFSAMFIYAEYSTPICSLLAKEWPTYFGILAKAPIPLSPPIAFAWGLFSIPILHIGFGVLARKWPVFGFLSPELPPVQPAVQPPQNK